MQCINNEVEKKLKNIVKILLRKNFNNYRFVKRKRTF